ncbi:MAG: rhomboid family intramembrane serine protease [Solirubrobacterales bacterium]
MEAISQTTCYRHPGRETGVSCSGCGRPICTDCMTASPVGMRCPECAGRTPGKRAVAAVQSGTEAPVVTIALIVSCVVAFFLTGGISLTGGQNSLFYQGGLNAFPIAVESQYWRLVTTGFLHAGLLHLAFNMILLWFLGFQMEPALGHAKFAAIYFVSLLGGAFGALLLSPDALTVGASGAIFGLMGAASVILYSRGINPFQTGIGMLLLFNLVFSFLLSNVSIGGHLGGLAAGALVGLGLVAAERRSIPAIGWGVCAAVGLGSVVAAIAVANAAVGPTGL